MGREDQGTTKYTKYTKEKVGKKEISIRERDYRTMRSYSSKG